VFLVCVRVGEYVGVPHFRITGPTGPPMSVEEVQKQWDILRWEFPGASIGTLCRSSATMCSYYADRVWSCAPVLVWHDAIASLDTSTRAIVSRVIPALAFCVPPLRPGQSRAHSMRTSPSSPHCLRSSFLWSRKRWGTFGSHPPLQTL
jgi:hypothetical protein